MDQTFGRYNNSVPPQGQNPWDFSALLGSGNSGSFTEPNDPYAVDEGAHMNMGNFNRPANLASFFNLGQTSNFVVPGQDNGSAFETQSAMEGENPSMHQRHVNMRSCVS